MGAIKQYYIKKMEEKGLDPDTIFNDDEAFEDFINNLDKEEKDKKNQKE